MRLIIILSLLIVFKAYPLDSKQIESVKRIIHYAKKYPDSRGYNYKTILLAIARVESSFCKNVVGDVKRGVTIYKASLGCFQFQLKTARWLINTDDRLKRYRKMSDWKLANRLLTDLEFQTMLASYYVQWILKHYGYKGLWKYNGSPLYQRKIEKAIRLNRKLLRRIRHGIR